MSTTEIVKNRKYKILLDPINKVWEQVSFWTHSDSVEMPNGKSLTTNLGDIHGITDSLEVASSDLAASTIAANTINDSVNNRLTANDKQFYFDYKNGQYGWNESVERGADTFHPFKVDKKTMFGTIYTDVDDVSIEQRWNFNSNIVLNNVDDMIIYQKNDSLPEWANVKPYEFTSSSTRVWVDAIIVKNPVTLKIYISSSNSYAEYYHIYINHVSDNSWDNFAVVTNYGRAATPLKSFNSGDYIYITTNFMSGDTPISKEDVKTFFVFDVV